MLSLTWRIKTLRKFVFLASNRSFRNPLELLFFFFYIAVDVIFFFSLLFWELLFLALSNFLFCFWFFLFLEWYLFVWIFGCVCNFCWLNWVFSIFLIWSFLGTYKLQLLEELLGPLFHKLLLCNLLSSGSPFDHFAKILGPLFYLRFLGVFGICLICWIYTHNH